MKRKRKIWYEVCAKGMWWCGRKLGWVTNLENVEYVYASSSRHFKTVSRALKHMSCLPSGSILSRYYYKSGKRYVIDFIKN
jgi:hypothetical protein